MKSRWQFIFAVITVAWLSGQWLAAGATAGNPYAPIITRNVFGLVPIPTNAPVELTPAVQPPKISPNGIMTVFGRLQVLFKVAGVAKPGQPPKDQSYVMSEGDRQDDIEVQKIDEPSATITFVNHGIVQQLGLVTGPVAGAGPAAAAVVTPGMVPPPRVAVPTVAPAAGGGSAIGLAGRFGRGRPAANPASAPTGAGNPATTSGTGETMRPNAIYQPANEMQQGEQMSPEQKIILIEAQRQKYLQEGNSMANLLPTTPITSQVTGEASDNLPPISEPSRPGQ